MENTNSPIDPSNLPAPQTSQTPNNIQENKSKVGKFIVIGILAVALISGSYFFMGSGNQNQGLARLKETPIPRPKTTSTPAPTPPPPPSPALTPEAFDASTMDIAFNPYPKYPAASMYFSNTSSLIGSSIIGNFKLTKPSYNKNSSGTLKESYYTEFSVQFCKNNLSKCEDFKPGKDSVLKNPEEFQKTTTISITGSDFDNIVKLLGLTDNEQFIIRYKINDPVIGEIFSKTLSFQALETKLDTSAMNISRIWEGAEKDKDTIYYNDPNNEVKFNVILPTIKNSTNDSGNDLRLRLCKEDNTNCNDIMTQNDLFSSTPNKVITVYSNKLNTSITNAKINNSEKGLIFYTVKNPIDNSIVESKKLTFTFFDYNSNPIMVEGQTLFDKNSMSIEAHKSNSYTYTSNQIFFRKPSGKAAIVLKLTLPSFDHTKIPNGKEKYPIKNSIKICNENLSQCKSIKDETTEIYSKNTQKGIEQITAYAANGKTISYDDLFKLLKELYAPYQGKFRLIYTIIDPSDIELQTSNNVEIVIDDYTKAYLNGEPISGSILDENTFKITNISSGGGNQISDTEIVYEKKDIDDTFASLFKQSELSITYQLPNIIPFPELNDQYTVQTILEYCKEAFSECTEVTKKTNQIMNKYDFSTPQEQKIVLSTNEKINMIKSAPDKSILRLKIVDQNNKSIYTNIYIIIKK